MKNKITRLFIILLAHIHTLTHLIFVHSKIYLAKYLEMCNIVYRLWYNTFQFRSLSLKGIIICSLKTWKCYSFTRKHRWLEEVTRKSGPWKWKLSFILVHTGSLNLFVIATATLLPFTKPSNSQGEMSRNEADFLHPSLPPNLGKVFPGVNKGIKTTCKWWRETPCNLFPGASCSVRPGLWSQ